MEQKEEACHGLAKEREWDRQQDKVQMVALANHPFVGAATMVPERKHLWQAKMNRKDIFAAE